MPYFGESVCFTVLIYSTNEIRELNTADYFTKTKIEELLVGSSGNLTYRGELLIKFTIDQDHSRPQCD